MGEIFDMVNLTENGSLEIRRGERILCIVLELIWGEPILR